MPETQTSEAASAAGTSIRLSNPTTSFLSSAKPHHGPKVLGANGNVGQASRNPQSLSDTRDRCLLPSAYYGSGQTVDGLYELEAGFASALMWSLEQRLSELGTCLAMLETRALTGFGAFSRRPPSSNAILLMLDSSVIGDEKGLVSDGAL